MIVGCYTLDLYCDSGIDQPWGTPGHEGSHAQITDELGSRCRAKARKKGWIIKRDGTAICPMCAGKKK